ncbi:MAG: flagellar basal body P-ring protein FlgI [Gemmataceae bacterium]|nr:flagellar basal body P-ring protein FlgI [Gemmataceae bacterium]MDW8266738.1 flagellar basal body P-ring protein FlgI [Gemmataceae bacterium]
MDRRVWAVGMIWLGLTGCQHMLQTRAQCEDEGERPPEVKTIGDVTTVANAEPIPVSGVGLVVGLEGTGGGAPPGGFRSILEDQLKKKGIDNVKELLNSPDCALVLVSALVPPGARKGDPIDIDVSLPPQSRTTSLRGGRLIECSLFNYDTTRNLDPNFAGGNTLVKGHTLVKAAGPLLVGLGDADNAAALKQGRIWGGGRCLVDRPFYLVLNADQQYARVAMRVAERINETFQSGYRLAPGSEIASAKTKTVVTLSVPRQYRHNLSHFLRVVRLIPLQEQPPAHSPYRRRLEEELLDPKRTVTAALRLEALGTESIPVLKQGLASRHALVRFSSAEALAYLGDPACGEELARLAEQQPILRAYCLTALASLNENICYMKLKELLASPSAETRCGAFRALQVLDDRDPLVQGEWLNESFRLHQVAPDSPPLVHISCSRQAEIVIFGDGVVLEPPFSFQAGPQFTVTASADDDRCTVSRFSLEQGTRRRQCSLQLADVIRTLAELGATYPDVVECLRHCDRCQCLSCRIAIDALPQVTSIQELARSAKSEGDLLTTDADILRARADLSGQPTLFELGSRRPTARTAHSAGFGRVAVSPAVTEPAAARRR